MEDFFLTKINDLKSRNLYRDQKLINERFSGNQEYVNFSSNDYLGLAENNLETLSLKFPNVLQMTLGSGGSRLTTGSHLEHKELEDCISSWKGSEDSILFSSGYLANLGALSVLVEKRDVVFIDELAHSCMWDALKISNSRKYIFEHNNITHLKTLLERYRSKYRNSFIVTESVFSMDGDLAPLKELILISKQHSSFLYIDEAHSTGIYGARGAGLVSEYKESNPEEELNNLIQMGTLSKAVGIEGGYISGSASLVDFLRNKARSYVYSTAASPLISKIAQLNIQKIINEGLLRQRLFINIQYLDSLLHKLGNKNERQNGDKYCWTNFGSPIFTIQFKDISSCITVSERLLQEGFICTTIRPPTVKTARLRICISSKHTTDQIFSFYQALSIALSA